MWRFRLFVARNLLWFVKVINKMTKLINSNSSEEERYEYMLRVIEEMRKKSNVVTEVYGTENLPEQGGYIMYPNHQGKYDAFSILNVHSMPCTVLMDKSKSYAPFIKQVIDLLKGQRLDKGDVRQSLTVINATAAEVAKGRRYIIFPEGEYNSEKKNSLIDFKAGCFKASIRSGTPIVPVAIFDSYKAWNTSSFGKVITQVHFLEPMYYDDYKDMSTAEISLYIKTKIQGKLNSIETK